MIFRKLVALLISPLLFVNETIADPAIEPLIGFEVGPNSNGPALRPRAPLYLHTDGSFYGTTPDGGAFGSGTLFKLSQSGIITSQSFSALDLNQPGSAPGSTPVLASDGWLWGTTSTGGVLEGSLGGGLGSVFRMRPETGEFQTVHTFSSLAGNSPASGLVADGLGYLWGTNQYTGNSTTSNGSIFRIHELTGVAEDRLTFANTSNPKGRVPQGALYYDGAGNLWGTTTSGGIYTEGTIFKFNIATSSLTTIAEFSGTSNPISGAIKGGGARSALVPDGNGFLWGVALTGGSAGGTVFKVEMATGTATSVLEFSDNAATNKGLSPIGPLVNDGAGFLWGVTSTGANSGKGSVFKIAHSTGVLTTVFEFGTLTGANINVRNPVNGLTNDGQGYLWGIASSYNAIAPTAVYKIKISDGSFTKVAEHPIGGVSYKGRTALAGLTGNASTPWLWGTTSQGGTHNCGTLFRYNPASGVQNVVINFTGQTGSARGSKPNGRVYIDAAGVVWGTTELGGSTNNGSVFKYDPATAAFSSVYSFVEGSGINPRAGLINGGDGFLWGTASASPNGAIFKINPTTGAYSAAYLFPDNPSEGSNPESELLADGAGNLWGTARFGGNGDGVLFKFTPATSTYTALVKFTGTSGSFYGKQPTGPLAIDASGNIWGTTGSATLFMSSVFKYAPATPSFTNAFVAEYNSYPLKSAFAGTISKSANGNIRFLGSENTHDYQFFDSARAVIYEINPTTNAVTKLRTLVEGVLDGGGSAGFVPAGGLYEHTDGQIYGITSQSGTDDQLQPAGGGMIYRVRTGPAAMTQPYSSTNTAFSTLFTTAGATQTLTLRGVVNPNANPITCAFEWGPTTALGNTLGATLSNGSGTGSLSSIYTATMIGLPSSRALFYRIRATSSGTVSYGPIRSVQTGPPVGTFPTPEIAVESPIGQGLIDNVTTVNLGTRLVGSSYKQQFVVRNLGNGIAGAGELNGLTATVTGANVSDFVISKPLSATTLTPTVTSAGLLLTFSPSAAGPRVATLTITSNDSDEGSFEIPLTGTGLSQPEIEVDSPASLPLQTNQGSYDFGSGPANDPIARNFTIRNSGGATLTGLNVTVDGLNSSEFVVTSPPPATIVAAGSSTFTVTFTPSVVGNRTATLHITSNDADENPFNIVLNGMGRALNGIESWRQTWFGVTTNSGDAADTADPDGDGYSNRMEFALAMNPTLSTTPFTQVAIVGANIEFTYIRSKAAVLAAVNYLVPWSDSLVSPVWNYGNTTEQVLADDGTIQTVKATIPTGPARTRFSRLEVR